MSTNDTLRGLLREVMQADDRAIAEIKAMGLEPRPESLVLVEKIRSAMAEPVSGGVVLPDRASRSNVDVTLGALGMYGRVDFGQAVKIYNQALDDVAALNGGAVAGQGRDACTCKGGE